MERVAPEFQKGLQGFRGDDLEFRCVRNPTRAVVLDGSGTYMVGASASGDGAFLEVSPGDLVQLQIEFSETGRS